MLWSKQDFSICESSERMKRYLAIYTSALLAAVLLVIFPHSLAQEASGSKAADLEAKLRQTLENSDEGARILIDLINTYYDEGQVFGLVRTGKIFAAAQPGHPQHEEMMGKLIDGLAVASQNADLKATILQYLERYPKSRRAADAHRMIAEVYERENQRREAADHYRQSWESRGLRDGGFQDAEKAMLLYRDLRSGITAELLGNMSLKLLDQLPADGTAAEVGYHGFIQTRSYGGHYQLSNQIARKMFDKKVPIPQHRLWDIHHHVGDNYRALKQYTNSVQPYRDAIAAGTPTYHSYQHLARSLYDSQADAKEIQKVVDLYQKNYPWPSHKVHSDLLHTLAATQQRAEDLPAALATMEQSLKLYAHHGSNLLNWTHDETLWQQAETIYRNVVAAKPEEIWRYHYYMAFNHYRDRRKDVGAAIRILESEVLYKKPLPNAGSEYGSALRFVLEQAKDEADFQKRVQRYVENAKINGQQQNYAKALETWLNTYRKSNDEEIRKRYKYASGQYESLKRDANIRRWASALQGRMKGHNPRVELLKTNLTADQKLRLLKLHAHDIHHHGDHRRRNEAVPFYAEAAKLQAKDYSAARAWLDSAANYGEPSEARAALTHILKLDADREDSSGWYLAAMAARKAEDKGMMQRALKWIDSQRSRAMHKNGYAGSITDQIRHLDMEQEEMARLRSTASREPWSYDHRRAVIDLANKLPEGKERIDFLKPYLDTGSDGYGDFASYLANQYLRQNDFANFEKVCREALKARDDYQLKRWYFPVADMVSTAQRSNDWTAEQKHLVYDLASQMQMYRDSAMGRLSLLEGQGHEMPAMQRLLAYRHTSLQSQSDGNSFNYLMAWAQKAIGRKEYAEAAAIGTGVLANITNVGVDYQDKARALIREAYGKMGALGMEVSADNPMAPLLEIGVHLKLGDQERALDAYSENRNRFDEFILELPAELVAFAADSHIAAGGEVNHERAESILRKWIVAHSESEKFTTAEKARMQLLLARNYNRSKRYEVARSEYTTVVNRYPETEEAVEARFGIGETQLAQKIFDQAEQTFTELSVSSVAKVRIRGMFLLGVLESRKGNTDDARRIFKDVLSSMPDVSLANETLFNLSEVYRGEQRYLEQLDLLRTVGRLGQESKRWHEPGRALSIVVQDSDLGISRGHTRIPVAVTTHPGGDSEKVYIVSGGAGKGLFMGEIETVLGEPQVGNGFLEVGGQDLIKVDYPDEFKSEFQFEPLTTGDIGLAADAEFAMASSELVEETEETESDRLAREVALVEGELRLSEQRPLDQIKPGNPVYLQVKDFDRDTTNGNDQVMVKLTASSGDEVQAVLKETGSHSGVFEGTIATSDLPAGALASDTAIEHSPLMAIDKDESSAWVSQPDGVTPKFLSVDLKELRQVDKGSFSTPDPDNQAPVRSRLQGSHDGRYWYPLAEHPQRPAPEQISGSFQRMTRRVWHLKGQRFDDWKQIQRISSGEAHETDEVDALSYSTELPFDPEERRKYKADPCLVIFQGSLVQPRSGAVRLGLRADHAAVVVNDFMIQPMVAVQREHEVDLYLEAGIHEVLIVASTRDSARRKIDITRSRENPNVSRVRLTPFTREDFDLQQSFVANLNSIDSYPLGTMSVSEDGLWQFAIEPRELRHVRLVVDEYLGQSVAINQVSVSGPEGQFIPTDADILQLSGNNVLEITPGDRIDSVYIDELPNGGEPRNRAISQQLQATYYDGTISSIAYDFVRQANGQVDEMEKELLRIDPGERITLKIVDYDMDTTGQRDQVSISLQLGNGEPQQLMATETESTSGVFKIEIDTIGRDSQASPDTAESTLSVGPGDQLFFTYRDRENTFPGHAIDRTSAVYVREPTDAKMRIIETTYTAPADEGRNATVAYLPASESDTKRVAYEVPLTIEVYDEDAARNSQSEVVVAVSIDGGDTEVPPVEVACMISSAFSDLADTDTDVANPALHRGRFVGQVAMRLGDGSSPRIVPLEPGQRDTALGRVLPPDWASLTELIDPGMLGVLNLTGANRIKVTYLDVEPAVEDAVTHTDSATMRGTADLVATDNSYEVAVEKLQVGERLFLRLSDPDRDVSSERDAITLSVTSPSGEKETIKLEETLSHSGVFTGSFKLKASREPVAENYDVEKPELEVFFGENLTITYIDESPTDGREPVEHQVSVPVSDGTDGDVAAFTKIYGDEDLAIQTQFHIAESYFELFKSHLKLGRKEESDLDLKNGQRILRELSEDYPDPKYAPRVAYLLGQFAQELKNWDEAIEAYETIVNQYPDHSLAADSQYKLGQCYEEAERLDEALEAYVTLAATYPQNPLISNVMIRINDHFYKKEDFEVAAQVGSRFLERFENHEWAPRMAFRVGQCYYKNEEYKTAGEAFDDFIKRFPEDDLSAQALFWAGESYRQGRDNRVAFQRYNRCRWDFPESDAAKYARGRLALPEMIQQFEREAQAVEMEQ